MFAFLVDIARTINTLIFAMFVYNSFALSPFHPFILPERHTVLPQAPSESPLRPFAALFPFSNSRLVFDLYLHLVHVFLIFFRALFHIPYYISDGYHPPSPSCRHPTSALSHMQANILLAGRPSLYTLSNPNTPSSGYSQHSSPSESWVRCDLSLSCWDVSSSSFSFKSSGSGSPSSMHNEFPPNQASVGLCLVRYRWLTSV